MAFFFLGCGSTYTHINECTTRIKNHIQIEKFLLLLKIGLFVVVEKNVIIMSKKEKEEEFEAIKFDR